MSNPTDMGFVQPSSDDEYGWIGWARLALIHEGPDAALRVLGAYLALNPSRSDELAAEWEASHAGADQR